MGLVSVMYFLKFSNFKRNTSMTKSRLLFNESSFKLYFFTRERI